MNKTLLFGGLLLSLLGTIGCACYGPGYGYGNFGGQCGGVIAPYSCGPSSCGDQGVDYVDGGPGAGNADCGGNYVQGCYGQRYGHYGNGSCANCIGNGLRIVGEGAVGLVAAPFILVGSLFNCGAYGNYYGCGCSNEVYYGDNCSQPHDFCDPCGGNGCDSGWVSPNRVGQLAYPPTTPGCTHCNGGYSEGIQPGQQPVAATPASRPQSILPMSMQRPMQAQRPMFVR